MISKLRNFIDIQEHFIEQNLKKSLNIYYIWTGACAADDDCDGDPICKTDNTCGTYTYVLNYEMSSINNYSLKILS